MLRLCRVAAAVLKAKMCERNSAGSMKCAPGAHFIEPALFRSHIFAFSTAAATLQSLSMFAVNFLLVFYLQGVKGVSPFQAALMILPLSLVQSVVGPIGGTLSDRI